MKTKRIQGKVWSGFIGECKGEGICPMYLLRPKGEAVFLCRVLKKFFGKRVQITIRKIK